jgi:large subunit ribosomal protein L4
LSALAKEDRLIVVNELEFPEPKTRQVVEVLKALKIDDDRRVLILTERPNANLVLSVRNMPRVNVLSCENLNTVDLGAHETLVATSGAVRRLQEVYA